jgi:putative ABC transport system permease protein
VYPNLLVPLLLVVGLCAAGLGWLLVRQPVSRRLAGRQIARRKTEAILVITGSVLGTAIIVGALIVGDTLNHSVRQVAYRTLGPIDERIVATDAGTGVAAAARLAPLAGTNAIDGVLTARVDQAAAVAQSGRAEPRVLVWDVDFAAANEFGRAGGDSGLGGTPPRAGSIVVNAPLARSLMVSSADTVTLFLYGIRHSYVIDRVVPERGLAGAGFGATVNRNVYLPAGDLAAAARAAGDVPRVVTYISNRGGVERGDWLTAAALSQIRDALGPYAHQVTIDAPKHAVLRDAKTTGDALGALFLMIGSFSIIAGALLLVNIFVMLSEERKAQLGMLRAIGMKRSRLIGALTLEGSTYAVMSILPGIGLGIGVGYGVAFIAAKIFQSWSQDGNGLAISFAVTPTSVVNGVALGLVIAIGTIFLTSVRISRFNIIAAIRDLPPSATQRSRRWMFAGGTTLAALTGVLAVPAIAASAAVPTLLLPAMTALFVVPALRRKLSVHATVSWAAGFVLIWTLIAPVVRPAIFDTPSMAVYVVQGSLLAFAAVLLVSENQYTLLWPVRRLLERPSETGLAARLAVAYPIAKRFRTGATLVMYALVTLVLVLLAEISGMINKSVDRNIADATAGYSLRLDVNPAAATRTFAQLQADAAVTHLRHLTPMVTALATTSDPGHRTSTPLRALAVGVDTTQLSTMNFDRRLKALPNAAAVWSLLARDPNYVVLDSFFGATGGPNGRFYEPGDTFTVTNPTTGQTVTKRIAGILKSAMIFYPTMGDAVNAFPFVGSAASVRALFGPTAQITSALATVNPGTNVDQLAPQLQGRYLASSLVATPVAANIRRMFDANTAFFRLMQGFLALGLLVGVTGLGVIMVRAVRERRRTIGVLRALGFRSRTVSLSFLIESGMVAFEGIVIGAVLGVLTTWLMYQKSAAFDGIRAGFPIVWGTIGILAIATFVASLAATIGPARRAAQIKPAVAVRVAD